MCHKIRKQKQYNSLLTSMWNNIDKSVLSTQSNTVYQIEIPISL